MKFARRRNRGSMMLGMAGLTFVLAMLCASVLVRSLECYRVSAVGEERLQARAAAEGAVVVLLPSPLGDPKSLDIGCCRVNFFPAVQDGNTATVPFDVEVRRSAERAVFTSHYSAHFVRAEAGVWEFKKLETRQ